MVGIVCGVCARTASKYTCPRCELAYCSLSCYQGHSGKCTERFYEAQVTEELQSQRASGQERRHLERVLSQLNKLDGEDGDEDDVGEDCDDDVGEGFSEDRLSSLIAKAELGQLSIDDLTPEEAQCFHSELKRGSLGQVLEPWQPWWHRAAVVDLSSLDDDGDFHVAPDHICCQGARTVHPAVTLTLLEALLAYVHTMLVFNGDWSWDPVQAALHFLHLAKATGTTLVYEGVRECLRAFLQAAASLPGGGGGVAFDMRCLTDVGDLLARGGGSAARALTEAVEIADRAEQSIANAATIPNRRESRELSRAAKKLRFLTSFAWHHEGLLSPLAPTIRSFEAEQEALRRECDSTENRLAHDGIALPPR